MANDNSNTGFFSKSNDLRNRIIFTVLVLSIYRLGTYIPLPGIDPQALQSLKQITDILHFADKMTTTKQISLNLSFEELLARSKAIDITPTDVVESSEKTSPEILAPDDTGTDLDLAESG